MREDFDRHPDDIEMDGGEMIANVSVTVDGTWQKRGYSSKIGDVFVISVEMGEILDYEVTLFMNVDLK
jgi:hypothetical protein